MIGTRAAITMRARARVPNPPPDRVGSASGVGGVSRAVQSWSTRGAVSDHGRARNVGGVAA